jgi:hypothetical protein
MHFRFACYRKPMLASAALPYAEGLSLAAAVCREGQRGIASEGRLAKQHLRFGILMNAQNDPVGTLQSSSPRQPSPYQEVELQGGVGDVLHVLGEPIRNPSPGDMHPTADHAPH